MAIRRTSRVALRTLAVASVVVLTSVGLAAATPPGQRGQRTIGGHVVGVRPLPPLLGPAGPTPLNPAGPTPFNPAGPPPVGGGFQRRFHGHQPGMFVGIVGGGGYGGSAGSYYCQVHDRGYASQNMFFAHLADADGLYGDDALPFLVDNGGVLVLPAE